MSDEKFVEVCEELGIPKIKYIKFNKEVDMNDERGKESEEREGVSGKDSGRIQADDVGQPVGEPVGEQPNERPVEKPAESGEESSDEVKPEQKSD